MDNNPATAAIAAGAGQLYQLHIDGSIWRSTGAPCSGNSCPGWVQLVPLSQKMSQKVAGAAVRESGSGAIPK